MRVLRPNPDGETGDEEVWEGGARVPVVVVRKRDPQEPGSDLKCTASVG